jgi:hypothetical protein
LLVELSNCVLLIGADARLATVVERAAMSASGARVIQADLSKLTTVATESRPFAIVAPKEIYEFGGSELDALARDVMAELLVVPHTVQPAVLTALLVEAAARLSGM